MDETYGTYVDGECFDIHDYDADTDHDTDDAGDDSDDGERENLYSYRAARLMAQGLRSGIKVLARP